MTERNKVSPDKVSETDQLEVKKAKALRQVVCICKGIPLKRFLSALKSCDSVACVHRKVGSGSGGCNGERCGPRIKALLAKAHKRTSRP